MNIYILLNCNYLSINQDRFNNLALTASTGFESVEEFRVTEFLQTLSLS